MATKNPVKIKFALVQVSAATFVAMLVYEVAKQFLFPSITIWQSHLVTIVFSSTVATIAAFFVLRRYETLNQQLSHELTERKRIAAALKLLNELNNGIIQNMADGLLIVDVDGIVFFTNPAAESFLGYDPGEIIGVHWTMLVPPEQHHIVQTANEQRQHQEISQYEIDLLHKNGQRLPVLISVSPRYEGGMFTGTLAVFTDVTHIRRLERARREMVSNITHELSTPITTIGLLAETLLNLQGKPKRIRKMVMDISREADTLTQLVQEVRDLSLIESGQMPVRLMATQLSATIAASVEPLRALAENKDQSIVLIIDDTIQILADDLQIQRAIKNIVHNAIKFSPEGGTIRVTATAEQDEATIAVTDEGPGIPADELPRIFERFYQVDRARRNGTGLGLAIVRHIARAHGGRTWAESIEGQGATFYIVVALADEQNPAVVSPK
jgi:two-component system phosphate regulon sensor histidine kinase PhoR